MAISGRQSPRRKARDSGHAIEHIETAIALVGSGSASAVRLVGVRGAEPLAAAAILAARHARVECAVERGASGSVTFHFTRLREA